MKRKIGRRKRKNQKKILIIGSLSLLLFLCIGYAAFSTQLTMSAKGNIKIFTTDNYIKDGLFALYDGIENTSNGHGTPITNWYNKALDLNPSFATPIQNTMNNFTTSSWTNDNGLEFNGVDNMIDTGYNQEVFGQEFTFSFVVNIKDGSAHRGLYGYHLGTAYHDPFYGVSMQMDGNIASFFHHGSSHYPSGGSVSLDKVLNKKQQYTVVYQGGIGVKLYINGQFVDGDSDNSYIVPYPDVNFIIGQSFPADNRYFQGTMYNFIIYKKVLNEEEIQHNYLVDKSRYLLK